MEIEAETIDYERPAIVEYGDFAAITKAHGHDPIDSGLHGWPRVDPHLTSSAG